MTDRAYVKFGNALLDEMVPTGFPVASTITIVGPPGSGKSTLGMQWLQDGVMNHNEPGMFLVGAETVQSLQQNYRDFAFIDADILGHPDMWFVDQRSLLRKADLQTIQTEHAVRRLFTTFTLMVRDYKLKRLVIDSTNVLARAMNDTKRYERFLTHLFLSLQREGCSALFMVTQRRVQQDPHHAALEALTDGIINLGSRLHQDRIARDVTVEKMRGATHTGNRVPYLVTAHGLTRTPTQKAST